MVHSQPAWLYTAKPALKKLSSTLPSTLSSTLPIALDNTLPAYLTIHSQLSSQDAPKYSEYVLKYTPGHAPKDAPTCTRWHTASLLDCTLPNQRSRSSQAHSWARSQVYSQLHSMTLPACLTIRSQVSSQDAPKNTSEDAPRYTSESLSSTLFIAGDRHQEVWSRWRLAGGLWLLVGGGWPAAYVVPNHDVGRYHSLNLIFSPATATKSHHASWSWCWQLQPLIQQER